MSNNLPSTNLFGDYNAGEDFKDMRASDLILPRLRLMAFNHQLVKERKAEAGAWVDTSTEATVIKSGEVGTLVPLLYFLEWIEWSPDKTAKKPIIARSTDPLSALAKSAERFEKITVPLKGERLRVTEYYSFLVLAPQYFGNWSDMMMLNFSKTGHKIGKSWLNRMRGFKVKDGEQTVQAPMWAVGWDVGSKVAVNDANEDYYIPVVGNGTLIPAEAMDTVRCVANECKSRRQALMDRNSNVADAATETEATVAGDADL